MSHEVSLLVWSVALTFVQMLVSAAGAQGTVSLQTLVGNRDDMPPLTGWAGRARRAHLNMLENLPLFAALVLAAQVSSKLNGTTLLGAEIFFWARLVYAVIYVAGIPWVRTLVWLVSVIGMLMIFSQLV